MNRQTARSPRLPVFGHSIHQQSSRDLALPVWLNPAVPASIQISDSLHPVRQRFQIGMGIQPEARQLRRRFMVLSWQALQDLSIPFKTGCEVDPSGAQRDDFGRSDRHQINWDAPCRLALSRGMNRRSDGRDRNAQAVRRAPAVTTATHTICANPSARLVQATRAVSLMR
jgi:hypothetical protein